MLNSLARRFEARASYGPGRHREEVIRYQQRVRELRAAAEGAPAGAAVVGSR